MPTARDIIKGAMKKLSVLASGREPTAAQAEDGLRLLQSLYRELVGMGVFGKLTDVLVTATEYEAHENERVVCDNVDGITVTMPETITSGLLATAVYGAPDYGRGYYTENLPRPPRDGSCVVVADVNSTFEKYYIYDGNTARWTLLDDLTLTSTAPLSSRYEDALKSILAVRWASEFGIEPSPFVLGQANSGRYSLSAKADRSSRPVQYSAI